LEAEQRRAEQQRLEAEQRRAEQQRLAFAEHLLQQQLDKVLVAQMAVLPTSSSNKKVQHIENSDRKLRFTQPQLFGPIPLGKKSAADLACQKIGGIKALGYHPRALAENGSLIPGGAYLCAFTAQELSLSRLISSTPASQAPRLEAIN
ncbi:MAG TPA: hypothetical protein PLB10_16480, partial [Thiolinea sp.]|nr:hypothetical protein [Thiolinea sp.]